MQNNGLVKLFAVLFVLVSIYQLSFTFIVNRNEDKARAYALEKIDEDSKFLENSIIIVNQKDFFSLKNKTNESIFNFQNGGRKLKIEIRTIFKFSCFDFSIFQFFNFPFVFQFFNFSIFSSIFNFTIFQYNTKNLQFSIFNFNFQNSISIFYFQCSFLEFEN